MSIEDTLKQSLDAMLLGRVMYNSNAPVWKTIDDAITNVYKALEDLKKNRPSTCVYCGQLVVKEMP